MDAANDATLPGMTIGWLAGGSGLVGGSLLTKILDDEFFSSVLAVGRRPLALENPKLTQASIDFAKLEIPSDSPAPDLLFSCLGSTMKKAGSKEAFRAVDYDAVLAFAKAGRARGARAFLHVSSIGASPRAFSFYAKVKGEIENAVADLGYESVYAFRPSFIDGERAESRFGENVGIAIAGALGPLIGKYRPTSVARIVNAMLAAAKKPAPGAHVIEPGAMP
jgi:uncharacterized protein YbjT (DUF2867 family)